MPEEWKLCILLQHNLKDDWERTIKMSFTVTSSCISTKTQWHPEHFIVRHFLLWMKVIFQISLLTPPTTLLFVISCQSPRCEPQTPQHSVRVASEGCCSLLVKPRNWDECELGFRLHKSSVSLSPLYLWKGPFDSRVCRQSTHTGCTKNMIQVHRKIGICKL